MTYDQFDVYISYASEDLDRVRRLVDELEWVGLKVWFLQQPFTSQESLQMLRTTLGPNACHLVVWTNNSAGSGRIQAEARAGSAAKKLIAVRLDPGIIPPKDTVAQFYADLVDWRSGNDHRGIKKVLAGVWALIGKGQQPDPSESIPEPIMPQTKFEFGANTEPQTAEQKDERAWQTCLTYNNRTYYEHYLRFFPNGRYAQEARDRIAKKKRTTTIVVTCAVIYIVGQILISLLVNIGKF